MAKHDDSVSLSQMRDHAREAVDFAKGRARSDLDADRLLNLALVRLVEVTGEAAKRVSAEARAKHTAIPWTHVVGMRDRLIHRYDEINFDILWETVTKDLPALLVELEKIVGAKE